MRSGATYMTVPHDVGETGEVGDAWLEVLKAGREGRGALLGGRDAFVEVAQEVCLHHGERAVGEWRVPCDVVMWRR